MPSSLLAPTAANPRGLRAITRLILAESGKKLNNCTDCGALKLMDEHSDFCETCGSVPVTPEQIDTAQAALTDISSVICRLRAMIPAEEESSDEASDDWSEPPPEPIHESWNAAVAALREVHYPLARNLCATVLRHAPTASTTTELQRIIRHVYPRARCYVTTAAAAFSNLHKEGLAEKEIHDGRDVGGNLRPLTHWSPTPTLRESFTETVPGNHYGPRLVRGPVAMNEEALSIAEKIKRRIDHHERRMAWHEEEIRRLEDALHVLQEVT